MVKKSQLYLNEVLSALRPHYQRMGWRGIVGGIGLAAASFCSAQTSRINFEIRPVWSGMAITQHMPMYAEVENNGVDTQGVISEIGEAGGLNVEYPVELPSGSRKRVLVFTSSYGNPAFKLRTRLGEIEARKESSYLDSSSTYGLISDNPDDLVFMRGNSADSNAQSGVQVGGCKPEDAPDRVTAYTCLDVLVLGEGSERLGEAQVNAIKRYVKCGGGLVFIGGVAKSASTASLWTDIRPAVNLSLSNSSSGGEVVSELTGQAAPWAKPVELQLGRGWIADYGFGSVGMLSVNPFESPVRSFSGRRAMMMKVAARNRAQAFGGFVSPVIQSEDSYPSSSGSMTSDPFEITAPSSANLAWVLLAYILVVVPVNFVVLRKLKRVELAWVTVPVISVVFSLLLLRSTIGLYQSAASTRTRAVVSLDGRGGDGIVVGRSEMFFPTADAHDLKLENLDGMYVTRFGDNYRYYGGNTASSMNFVDNGRSLVAPACDTTNLAFREFTYVQTTDALRGIRCSAMRTRSGYRLTLTNGSSFELENVLGFTPGSSIESSNKVASGQTIELNVSNAQLTAPPPKSGNQNMRLAYNLAFPVYLQFEIRGVRLGPGWGAAHPGSRATAVLHPVLLGGSQ